MTRIVFADTETTHLDPQVGHIWELALIVRDPGEEDVEYLWQIRPDLTNADPNSLRVGGYYDRSGFAPNLIGAAREVVHPTNAGHRDAEDVAQECARLLDDAVLVGQNVQFDAAHLAAFLRRNGQAYTAHYRPICVTTMAAGFLAMQGVRLELPWRSSDVARAVHADPEEYSTHTALGDARLALAIYDSVMGGAS